MNKIYDALSRIRPLAGSYTFKFLFVAFLGIHIPLIGLIFFLIFQPGALSPATIFVATLILTLAATALTLFILNRLLEPLHLSKVALESYMGERAIPSLPQSYTDEAGVLMCRVQETIMTLDTLLEEKKDLIGLLSHDLRTPLATILLISKQLEREPKMADERRQRLAGMISASTADQIALFRRILEILKNDDINKLHLQLADITVDEVLENSLKDLQLQAERKNLRINFTGKRDHMVRADIMLISQVIKNLVSNAIKFSFPDASIRIHVQQQEHKTRIDITDSGLGFEPGDAQSLFTRFTEKRKTGTANEVSTGMGLYLSNKIMKAHNGSLSATSEGVNKGATFSVEI